MLRPALAAFAQCCILVAACNSTATVETDRSTPTAVAPPTPAVPTPPPPPDSSGALPMPPGGVTVANLDAIAIELHERVVTEAPFFAGREPPEGLDLVPFATDLGSGGIRVIVERTGAETLAQTLVRVRPWLDAITLEADQKWSAELVPPAAVGGRVAIELFDSPEVTLRGSDIVWVARERLAGEGIRIELTESGRSRLNAALGPENRDLAVVIAGRVVSEERLSTEDGPREYLSLNHMHDERHAATVRDAIAGDPVAIAALAENRVDDGGTREQAAAAEGYWSCRL